MYQLRAFDEPSTAARPRHFLDIDDLGSDELALLLDFATSQVYKPVLAGKGVGLIFEKPSNRTRNSMEMAVVQLGGHPLTMRGEEIGFDTRETVEDVAKTLSGYHAVIGARVHSHTTLERLSAAASVPVVNLLSDRAHPCQTLADLVTIKECFGRLEGLSVAYVGDSNNVCRSLALGAAMSGMDVRVASPHGFGLDDGIAEKVRDLGGNLTLGDDPAEAVRGAHAVYTDTWVSMDQEAETELRHRELAAFQVDSSLMALASPSAVFLHCLPAHRGQEVTSGVLDGPQSVVWQQAENRMHAQRALLYWLMGGISGR